MEIKCPVCESGYRIPDEKLPTNKNMIVVSCPNCSHHININLKKSEAEQAVEDDVTLKTDSGIDIDTDDVSQEAASENQSEDTFENPFAFLEEGSRTALICESNPGNRQIIHQSLADLNFVCADADSVFAALNQLRYHPFDLIVLNERFDGKEPESNPLRISLSRLPMPTRRNFFVALLTNRFQSMDNMAAFNLSVNQVIHEKDLPKIKQIIQRGLTDHDVFYKVFWDTWKSMGAPET